MLNILIKNGKYPDFEAGELRSGNIGIKDGKIEYIGADEPDAEKVIDASGLVVSPGFIDIHMHEEFFEKEGLQYYVAQKMLEMGVTTALGGNCGDIKQPVRAFRDAIEKLGGSPINYMLQTGYNYYRVKEGLGRHEVLKDPEQQNRIIEHLKQDIADGANGISFGIEYDPAMTTEDIIDAINRTIDDPEMICSAHYREDGPEGVPAVKELIEITDNISTKFQISHLSSCSAFGNMREALDVINAAMERNPRLNYDTYPYNAFQTSIGSAVYEDGCLEWWGGKDYSDILLKNEPYKNVRCTKEIFEDARANYPDIKAVAFVMNEEDIAMAIANKNGMIGSDGSMKDGEGHPRAAGTFPRVLGKYVREEGVISLIDALRKMTLTPAERLGLDLKGRIKEGCDADLTLFNPDTVIDGSTFENLHIKPTGIEYVLIAGKLAMEHNETVNNRLGRFIPFSERRKA